MTTIDATRTVELVTGGDPGAHVKAPRDGEFGGEDFLLDDRLDTIGEALRPVAGVPGDPIIVYRWKRKGGESNGKSTFGTCVKLSGHAKHFAGAHYLIWVAADHVRQAEFDARQLEALLYHELKHVVVEYDEKTDEPAYKIVGHDAELFLAEYERYGPWRFDLERVEATMRQTGLFDGN